MRQDGRRGLARMRSQPLRPVTTLPESEKAVWRQHGLEDTLGDIM
jgi:hypothetical protein